jgi:hypothetical protein
MLSDARPHAFSAPALSKNSAETGGAEGGLNGDDGDGDVATCELPPEHAAMATESTITPMRATATAA